MVKEYDEGIRLQALTLVGEGLSRREIIAKTGYSTSGLCTLIHKAKTRGFVPGGPILRHYVTTEPGKGRKPILTEERTQRLVNILTSDVASRKFSGQQLTELFNEQSEIKEAGVSVSVRTIQKVLAEQGYRKVKLPTKPGSKTIDRIWQKPQKSRAKVHLAPAETEHRTTGGDASDDSERQISSGDAPESEHRTSDGEVLGNEHHQTSDRSKE